MENVPLSVTDAIALVNQTLEYAYPTVVVEGEVSSFKVNQGKFVFFDIKDSESSLGCFMMIFNLRVPLEDGMKIRVIARPTLTKWGKFSLTVRDIVPVGEGSIKRAFQLLKEKLDKEGLFAAERKRSLPYMPSRIGVISSTQAAGYGDFIKILSDRWGGMDIVVVHTQVQGADASRQIVSALKKLNELSEPVELIAVIRGGGSIDDLAVFNDGLLIRAVAASRAPVISGVGHEQDETLIDFVADERGSTPSNVAERIVPDKRAVTDQLSGNIELLIAKMKHRVQVVHSHIELSLELAARSTVQSYERSFSRYAEMRRLLSELDPRRALMRGYSLMRTEKNGPVVTSADVGDTILIETKQALINAEVTDVNEK